MTGQSQKMRQQALRALQATAQPGVPSHSPVARAPRCPAAPLRRLGQMVRGRLGLSPWAPLLPHVDALP